jgi:hypothetical protein
LKFPEVGIVAANILGRYSDDSDLENENPESLISDFPFMVYVDPEWVENIRKVFNKMEVSLKLGI